MNSNSPDLRKERYWSFSIALLSLPSGRKISPLGVLLFKVSRCVCVCVCVFVCVGALGCVRSCMYINASCQCTYTHIYVCVLSLSHLYAFIIFQNFHLRKYYLFHD